MSSCNLQQTSSIVNNTVTCGVTWLDLKHPSETTIWTQQGGFRKQPFLQALIPRAGIINCWLPRTSLVLTEHNRRKPRCSWNTLGFRHRLILWCSAINYCYTTIINNFLNENDSVDLCCILIIRVKHNYTAALSWHADSFRVQFCFNTLIM